jgi:hypothetical protein
MNHSAFSTARTRLTELQLHRYKGKHFHALTDPAASHWFLICTAADVYSHVSAALHAMDPPGAAQHRLLLSAVQDTNRDRDPPPATSSPAAVPGAARDVTDFSLKQVLIDISFLRGTTLIQKLCHYWTYLTWVKDIGYNNRRWWHAIATVELGLGHTPRAGASFEQASFQKHQALDKQAMTRIRKSVVLVCHLLHQNVHVFHRLLPHCHKVSARAIQDLPWDCITQPYVDSVVSALERHQGNRMIDSYRDLKTLAAKDRRTTRRPSDQQQHQQPVLPTQATQRTETPSRADLKLAGRKRQRLQDEHHEGEESARTASLTAAERQSQRPRLARKSGPATSDRNPHDDADQPRSNDTMIDRVAVAEEQETITTDTEQAGATADVSSGDHEAQVHLHGGIGNWVDSCLGQAIANDSPCPILKAWNKMLLRENLCHDMGGVLPRGDVVSSLECLSLAMDAWAPDERRAAGSQDADELRSSLSCALQRWSSARWIVIVPLGLRMSYISEQCHSSYAGFAAQLADPSSCLDDALFYLASPVFHVNIHILSQSDEHAPLVVRSVTTPGSCHDILVYHLAHRYSLLTVSEDTNLQSVVSIIRSLVRKRLLSESNSSRTDDIEQGELIRQIMWWEESDERQRVENDVFDIGTGHTGREWTTDMLDVSYDLDNEA